MRSKAAGRSHTGGRHWALLGGTPLSAQKGAFGFVEADFRARQGGLGDLQFGSLIAAPFGLVHPQPEPWRVRPLLSASSLVARW